MSGTASIMVVMGDHCKCLLDGVRDKNQIGRQGKKRGDRDQKYRKLFRGLGLRGDRERSFFNCIFKI
jgi:hypothetical protein